MKVRALLLTCPLLLPGSHIRVPADASQPPTAASTATEVKAWLTRFATTEFGEPEPNDELRRQFIQLFSVSGRLLLQRRWQEYERCCAHNQVLRMWAEVLFDALHPPVLQENDGTSQMLAIVIARFVPNHVVHCRSRAEPPPTPTRDSSVDDVEAWLHAFAVAEGVPIGDLVAFQHTGRTLLSLTEQQCMARSGRWGDVIYNALHQGTVSIYLSIYLS